MVFETICRVKLNSQIPWWLTAGCNERVTDQAHAYTRLLDAFEERWTSTCIADTVMFDPVRRYIS